MGIKSVPSHKQSFAHIQQGHYKIGDKFFYFRSKWEANYALYLEWLKARKDIQSWEFEPHTFWFEGIRRGTNSYKPDFRIVTKNGKVEWHEVKGYLDAKSRTKIKRMAKYFPEEKLIVIDSGCYADIKNKVGKIIKFYS